MSDDPVMLTKRGLAALRAELEQLTTVRRAEVAAAIRDAQEAGLDQKADR